MSRVAVIMSVYKNDLLSDLKCSVESIINQTYSKLDLFLCVDGYIEDETRNYLELVNFTNNINIIDNERNIGLAKSLNKLIDIVVGRNEFDYIARMDSDDISHPTRIEKQVAFMNANSSIDVSGCFCKEFGASYALDVKSLPLSHDELVDFSIARCPFIHPTVIFKSSIFNDSTNRYPINTTFTEDMGLWFMLIDKSYQLGNLDEVLLDYRLNESTVKRRLGFSKGVSELKLRNKYIYRLGKVSVGNLFKIYSRLFFHMLPVGFVKYLYKNLRG